jgi:outer membrane protein OmpA-like peptidoglycan-associated protein
MPNSTLSFVSSSSFRDSLMAKNLAGYTVNGVYTPPSGPLNYEINLTQSPVVDSPGDLIANDPFANQLYPLNQFGPSGGYDINISFNGIPLPVNSNQGPYLPNESALVLGNNLYLNVLPTSPLIQNKFIPLSGEFNYVYNTLDIQNNNNLFLPYVLDNTVTPATFIASIYSPYDILLSTDPSGSNGKLSSDSFIAKLGAKQLNILFQERINFEIYQNTIGLVNLQSLSDPFEASLLASGQEPLVYRNWRITVPESPVTAAFDFATRLSGAYWPVSFIPGDYFDENTKGGLETQQTSTALNVVNQLTGGFLGPILNIKRNPSQIFLANTGNGQRSVLFNNLDFNRYQPGYKKDFGGILGIAQAVVNLAESIINPNGTLSGGYYVGSTNSEPSTITSPSDAIPVDPYGQQVESPVYGPSELSILFEGNQEQLNFGLAGKSLTDDGGIDGGLVWVSPKYKSNAGFKATPGGGSGSKDEEFNQISSNYQKAESTNIEFKENSILDNTQRLIDSADNVSGINRLKHVGNAMNQVSKVFHDGYREMTKGSKVLSYADNTDGSQKGIEYCRVFTKDTPYYTYADLQKTDGITTSGRRFTYSVLDNTYNLNIAPLKGIDSTNIIPDDANGKGGYAKKYMFSIENLAWRTSSRPGYTYDDLPVCERGPNGGRVMWFPPYGLQFNDTSSADWGTTVFMGRPEPIYTYKSTSRTGSLQWKMIVDHPSVMNTVVEKQLKGASKERIESIIDSFFAGCTKYDIYQLAIKFNTLSVNDLYTYQEILSNPRLTDVETLGNINKEIPKKDSDNANTPTADVSNNNQNQVVQPDNSIKEFEDKYLDFAFYFENDIPGKNPSSEANVDFETAYKEYTSQSNIDKYKAKADSSFNPGDVNRNVGDFFKTVIEGNYKKIAEGDKNFITDAFDIISKGLGTITIEMEGSASAIASVSYNKKLSERRVDSVTKFLKSKTIGEKNLAKFFDEEVSGRKKFKIVNVTTNGEEIVIPKQSVETGSGSSTATTENSGTGQDVDCRVDIKNKNGVVVPSVSQVFAANAMACRRVRIKTIKVEPLPPPPKEPEPPRDVSTVTSTQGNTETIPVKKPQPEVSIQKKIKEGISKKILRNLLSECDYFQVIKENSPMVYDSFKEKIKYFNPTFHSMTPEGLNSRLTFLNQCVRPGETIPVISDNKVKSADAINTSFGSAPVLVLRIGDFYHTKIIPDSVAFTYEPLVFDMNPEGIGVQPMLANVTLSFKIIGGMGLKEPVDQLQNALSFNYYGNTEIFDERATWTEDTSALDKMVVDAIIAKQPPVTVNNTAAVQQTNDAGQTIGEIKTTTPLTPSGETGEMSYMKIMDKLYDDSKTYFTNTYNSMDEIRAKTNYGMLSVVCSKRNFVKGVLNLGGVETGNDVSILGKPVYQENIDKLFQLVIDDINSGNNPILVGLDDKGFSPGSTDTTLNIIKTNLIKYVKSLKGTILNDIGTIVNSKIGIPQQEFVQTIRKVSFVNSKTDGKILDNGSLKIYNLTSGADFDELVSDYTEFKLKLNDYYTLLTGVDYDYKIIPDKIPDTFDYDTVEDFKTIENKRFYIVIGRVFEDKNKVQDFITKIITPNIVNEKKPKKLSRVFENIVDDLVGDYKDELKNELKTFEKFKKNESYEKYINGLDELLYKKGKPRIVNFTTEPDPTEQANKEKNLLSLYKGDENQINNFETFDGKIKFN